MRKHLLCVLSIVIATIMLIGCGDNSSSEPKDSPVVVNQISRSTPNADINNTNNGPTCFELGEKIKASNKQLASLYYINGMAKGEKIIDCYNAYSALIKESAKDTNDIEQISFAYENLISLVQDLDKSVNSEQISQLNDILNSLKEEKNNLINELVKSSDESSNRLNESKEIVTKLTDICKNANNCKYDEQVNEIISYLTEYTSNLTEVIAIAENYENIEEKISEARNILNKLMLEKEYCNLLKHSEETIELLKNEQNAEIQRALVVNIENGFANLFLASNKVNEKLKNKTHKLSSIFKNICENIQQANDNSLLQPLTAKLTEISDKETTNTEKIEKIKNLIQEAVGQNISRKTLENFITDCNKSITVYDEQRLKKYNEWSKGIIVEVFNELKEEMKSKPGLATEVSESLSSAGKTVSSWFSNNSEKDKKEENSSSEFDIWCIKVKETLGKLGQIDIRYLLNDVQQCYQEVYNYGMMQLKDTYRVDAALAVSDCEKQNPQIY